jgi:serine phosphatase RsbU (regulator of sigma subunit)
MTQDHHLPPGLVMRCMEIRGGSRAVEESLNTPGLDAWVYSRPYEGDERGGDVYYVSLCGGGLITRIVVADVSGHGARVADFSSALRDQMRKNINTKSQTRLVKALNREFGASAQSLRFATAVVATYLANLRRLTICNAGHPRPLWYRVESGQWEWLDHDPGAAGNFPLGVDDDSPYRQFAVDLGPGDVVLFYTDALTEAADESGTLLGEEGLIAMARGLDPAAPDRIGPSLLAGIERYRGGRPADDDVTLLTIVHNAGGPRAPTLGEKIDIYAKVFGLKAV